MRILILGPATPIVLRLFEALRERHVDVFLASHNVTDCERIINLGEIGSFFEYFNFSKINTLVSKIKPDVIHAHIVNHYGLMALFANRPIVQALWGSEIMIDPYEGRGLRRLFFRMLNWIVLKRAEVSHTSGGHVALEAIKQCPSIETAIEVFYWGLPIARPATADLNEIAARIRDEFCVAEKHLVIFNRGLSKVYNPDAVAYMINALIEHGVERSRIVLFQGFSSEDEVLSMKEKVNFEKIIFINRILTSDELYILYQCSDVHFSIPLSDSLGGGVVEPALLGSFPILSDLGSYIDYAKSHPSYIFRGGEIESNFIASRIKENFWVNKKINVPVNFAEESVVNKILSLYRKSLS